MTPVGVFFCWQGGAERDFVNSTKMSWIFFQIPLNYAIYILFEIEKIWGVAAGKREVK